MSSYKIKKRQLAQAKKLGVIIEPSGDSGKKIDVFAKPTAQEKKEGKKKGKKLASIGGFYDGNKIPYGDYATYLQNPVDRYGNPAPAEERRKSYLKRHSLEPKKKKDKDGKEYFTPSYWADKILWG